MVVKVPLYLSKNWTAFNDARQALANDFRLRQLVGICDLENLIGKRKYGFGYFVRASTMKTIGLRHLGAGRLKLTRYKFVSHRSSRLSLVSFQSESREENTTFRAAGQPSTPQVIETTMSNAEKLNRVIWAAWDGKGTNPWSSGK